MRGHRNPSRDGVIAQRRKRFTGRHILANGVRQAQSDLFELLSQKIAQEGAIDEGDRLAFQIRDRIDVAGFRDEDRTIRRPWRRCSRIDDRKPGCFCEDRRRRPGAADVELTPRQPRAGLSAFSIGDELRFHG